MNLKRRIHVVGGAGGIGKWMQEKIFNQCGDDCEIFCYDIKQQALSELSKSIVPCLLDKDIGYAEYKKQFGENDWIVYAIPLNHLEQSIKEINQYTKKGSLYISLTSTQSEAMSILARSTPGSCSYIGCHPLFGPSLSSPVAQVAALVNYQEDDAKHKELKSCLANTGLMTSEISAKDHDRNMSVIQALTHFTYLSFAHTLSKNGYKPKSLLHTTTPNFQFLYAFTSRVLKITPTTTGAIQNTEDAAILRRCFKESVNYLDDKFSSCSDVEEAAEVIKEIREPFAGHDISEGVEIAAIAVDSVQRIEELFYRYKKKQYPFIFKSKTTGKLHIVKITGITKDSIKYIESTKRISKEGNKYFALGLDSTSRKNYQKIGVNLQNPYEESIKKRNVELLAAGDLIEFKRTKLLPVNFHLTVDNPFKYDEIYFENWLPLLVEGVWDVLYKEAYTKRGQLERVSLVITHNPSTSMKKITDRIKNVIEDRLIEDKKTNKLLQRTLASSHR